MLLALGAAWALTSMAESRAPVVALVPLGSSDELRPLALLVGARASAMLDGVAEVPTRETVRVLREERIDVAGAGALGALLGAERLVLFRLTGSTTLTLELTVTQGRRSTSTRVPLGTAWSEALERGGAALAKATLGRPARAETASAQPRSASDPALLALGRCYAVVLEQPLAVTAPSLVDATELGVAIEACRSALALDPSLRFASATLALAEVLAGADADAVKTLSALGEPEDGRGPSWLARFWLLTRYQSNTAGVAFLTGVLARRPGALEVRAALAEALMAAGSWSPAEAAYRRYAAMAPASSWAQGRLSRALARMGRHAEAVAAAKRGLALSPKGLEARYELGARLLEAGQPAAAKEQLKPLADRKPPRGEDLLRLGAASWQLGQVDAAASYFGRALDAASGDAEWRTRARAFYELALVEAKRGRPDAARVALRASLRTGLQPREVDPLLAEVARDIERSDSGGMMDGGRSNRPSPLPREASLFPLDRFGEPDPAAPKPPPPEGLALFPF